MLCVSLPITVGRFCRMYRKLIMVGVSQKYMYEKILFWIILNNITNSINAFLHSHLFMQYYVPLQA